MKNVIVPARPIALNGQSRPSASSSKNEEKVVRIRIAVS